MDKFSWEEKDVELIMPNTAPITKEDALQILTKHCSLPLTDAVEAIAEYVNEAGHMEGTEYWGNFKTEKDLTDDFDLYIQNKD